MRENDLVCALSEIDKWAVLRSVLQWSLPPSNSWEESWNFPGQWTLNGTDTIGRCWPLLTAERGEHVVARGGDGLPFLQTLANTANDGGMIPEQVWDQSTPAPAPYGYLPGKATGSASPLAWAMAQYVRLSLAIDNHKPVETPAVVAQRYASGTHFSVPTLTVTAPQNGSLASQSSVHDNRRCGHDS
jgi:hypothetical protein